MEATLIHQRILVVNGFCAAEPIQITVRFADIGIFPIVDEPRPAIGHIRRAMAKGKLQKVAAEEVGKRPSAVIHAPERLRVLADDLLSVELASAEIAVTLGHIVLRVEKLVGTGAFCGYFRGVPGIGSPLGPQEEVCQRRARCGH